MLNFVTNPATTNHFDKEVSKNVTDKPVTGQCGSFAKA